MKERIILILLIQFFMITSVSGEIYFSGLKNIYNFGEILSTEVNVQPFNENLLLRTELICDGESLLKLNNYPNSEGKVEIKLPLNPLTVSKTKGRCFFSSRYGNETAKSKLFEISNEVKLFLDFSEIISKPGEKITISGTAKKPDNEDFEGNIRIRILKVSSFSQDPNKILLKEFFGKAEKGKFSITSPLPSDAPSGIYKIEVYGYKEVEGYKTLAGYVYGKLKIKEILTNIKIAMEKQILDPGENLTLKIDLLSQDGKKMEGYADLIIIDEQNRHILEKKINTQDLFIFELPTNLSYGTYVIKVSADNLTTFKKFFVNKKQLASFELNNNILVVKNIGNVPYEKSLEIKIGDKSFIRRVSLELGESAYFRLSARNGTYSVKISDGTKSITDSLHLTGYSIKIEKMNDSLNFDLKLILLSLVLILIIGVGIAKSIKNWPLKRFKKKVKDKKKPLSLKMNTLSDGEAEHTLVLQGVKNKATFVGIKIKSPLNLLVKSEVNKIITKNALPLGSIYRRKEDFVIIFTPLITKTFQNEILAIKSVIRILKEIRDFSKKTKEKINLGIAVSHGEIINQLDGKKLKFTALKNSLSKLLKIADYSFNNIYLSHEVYEQVKTDVKTDLKEIDGKLFYELRSFHDSKKYQEFIENFLKRNEG